MKSTKLLVKYITVVMDESFNEYYRPTFWEPWICTEELKLNLSHKKKLYNRRKNAAEEQINRKQQ